MVVEITEEDTKTELKCVAQNQGGRQEVVSWIRLESECVCVRTCVMHFRIVFLHQNIYQRHIFPVTSQHYKPTSVSTFIFRFTSGVLIQAGRFPRQKLLIVLLCWMKSTD